MPLPQNRKGLLTALDSFGEAENEMLHVEYFVSFKNLQLMQKYSKLILLIMQYLTDPASPLSYT